jgi:hypothetical protein
MCKPLRCSAFRGRWTVFPFSACRQYSRRKLMVAYAGLVKGHSSSVRK